VRIAAGEANAVIGADILCTAENAIVNRMQRGVTRAVINTNRNPTVAFIKQPDLVTPWEAMEDGLREAIGADGVRFVDATRLANALLGDGVATNLFLLGYAWQMGLVPLSATAIDRAIELNGTSVESNRRAFGWGRLACHDPARVESLAKPPETAIGSDRRLSDTLDEAVARRVEYLTAYQDASFARRYRALVDRVRAAEQPLARGNRLTDAVARGYFKLLAIKDEYEVARLYTDGEFERMVASAFEGDYRIAYHFAPPLWVKPDPVTGTPRKRRYGPWMRPLLAILARLKGLRGTPLDVFGYSDERRRERQLIADYERLVDEVGSSLRHDTLSVAVELAALPEAIRGYGHVKLANFEAARVREAELLLRLRAPVEHRVAIAAD
jgi:indolepyruvate ferredoxin oxidoreductase